MNEKIIPPKCPGCFCLSAYIEEEEAFYCKTCNHYVVKLLMKAPKKGPCGLSDEAVEKRIREEQKR